MQQLKKLKLENDEKEKWNKKKLIMKIRRGLEFNPNITPLPGRVQIMVIDLTNSDDDFDGPTERWQNRYVFLNQGLTHGCHNPLKI